LRDGGGRARGDEDQADESGARERCRARCPALQRGRRGGRRGGHRSPASAVLDRVLSDLRPELVEHLVLASREVLLAARALIDARLEGMPPPSSKLERLTIG
jgi:hypothetical protein